MAYFDAVIFDIDGTLVTSGDYRYIVTKKALNAIGKRANRKEIDEFWFGPYRNKTIREEFEADPREFWESFRRHDTPESRIEYTRPFEDAKIVNCVRDSGIKTGAVTGADPEVVQANLSLLDESQFNRIIVAHPSRGIKGKPSPEGLHRCMDDLGVSPGRSLYVGNSDEDILMAREASVPVALLSREGEELSHQPTFLLFRSLYELRELVGI